MLSFSLIQDILKEGFERLIAVLKHSIYETITQIIKQWGRKVKLTFSINVIVKMHLNDDHYLTNCW